MAILTDAEFEQARADAVTHRADIKTLQERAKAIDADIIETLFAQGEADLKDQHGSWKVENKVTRTIDKAQLVAHGVEPSVIDECTRETVSDPFLRLYPVRAKKEQE